MQIQRAGWGGSQAENKLGKFTGNKEPCKELQWLGYSVRWGRRQRSNRKSPPKLYRSVIAFLVYHIPLQSRSLVFAASLVCRNCSWKPLKLLRNRKYLAQLLVLEESFQVANPKALFSSCCSLAAVLLPISGRCTECSCLMTACCTSVAISSVLGFVFLKTLRP